MNANTTLETDAAPCGDAHELTAEYEGPSPTVKAREDHSISRRDIDPDALKVLYRLSRNNYIAYLVGGGVRDLLLGRKPKDFDISTNAKPEQIRSLFRNCILIGRRFRLAHIRYGEKIIETSTFRSTPKQLADPTDPDADLFQRDDNLFGNPAEDALRRDFTVNGLFYDIESFSIIDYVGGMEDLAARRIRSIGDPCIRFREDPVRMVRAIRFASRLDFTLDAGTEEAIQQYCPELTKASPARLLEEITRLFAFSSGEKAVGLLRSTGLLNVIMPEVDACLDADAVDNELFWTRLRALDRGDTVLPDATPALIFAVLLLDPLKMHLGRSWSFEDTPRLRFDKLHSFMEPLAQRLRFPRKLVDRIIHMYLNQNRFCNNSAHRGKRGSLANFVTQDAFHESLALAEIILSSENGQQMRLNQWREMLQDRIYGRDDSSHHGGNHHHNGQQNRDRQAEPEAAVDDEQPVTMEVVENNAEAPGRKLSRSARRRRNKRLRRGQQQEKPVADSDVSTTTPTTPEVAPVSASAPAAAATPPVEAPAVEAPRGNRSRNNQRGRAKVSEPREESAKEQGETKSPDKRHGNKPDAAESNEPANRKPAESQPGENAPPPKPLTAAAFWKEPEPEPAPEPEKKKRGRKSKSDAAGKKSAKAKAAEEKSEPKSEPKPLSMDRADEAEIPMHWLDEI